MNHGSITEISDMARVFCNDPKRLIFIAFVYLKNYALKYLTRYNSSSLRFPSNTVTCALNLIFSVRITKNGMIFLLLYRDYCR